MWCDHTFDKDMGLTVQILTIVVVLHSLSWLSHYSHQVRSSSAPAVRTLLDWS